MHASLNKRLKEAGFLLLLAISAFFVMALVSYSPEDPSWSYAGPRIHAHNAAGPTGAWVASVLFSLVGLMAHAFPFMLAWAGWMMFRDRNEGQPHPYLWVVRSGGFLLTLVGATSLASLHVRNTAHLPEGAGGILGQVLGDALVAALGHAGTSLLMLTALLIGFTLFSGVSWLAIMDTTGDFVLKVWRQAGELMLRWNDRREAHQMKQERQQVRLKEKKRTRNKQPPKIEKHEPVVKQSIRVEKERQLTLLDPPPNAELPPLSLLDPPKPSGHTLSADTLQALSGQVERKLADFGVTAEVVAVPPGPVVPLFELSLAPGTKASKVSNLAKDLARALSTISVRVVEVIPGKSVIGLEIPNPHREVVYLSEILRSEAYDPVAGQEHRG